MITIVTVNYNAYDFLELLIESIQRTSTNCQVVIIDNSEYRKSINFANIYQFFMEKNIGHGKGLNLGVTKALELFPNNQYIMFLDSDCHFLCSGWETAFISKMKNNHLIGAKGSPVKPIRPACMFMKKDIAYKNDWMATDNYQGARKTPNGYDVAIKAYYKLLSQNCPIWFLEKHKNKYSTANGEVWGIDEVSYVYHHWHGSHLENRQVDFPDIDLITDKEHLFSQIPWRLP